MKFVAIDVETANADMASICAIGLAGFDGAVLTSEWHSLVDPHDVFASVNVAIHGIKPSDVIGAPRFADAMTAFRPLVEGHVVVTHTHFDRAAVMLASERYGLAAPDCIWLDSAKVARRTWDDCARSGYGLAKLCERIGYSFRHHDALEDAKAAGHVLIAASRQSGLNLEGMARLAAQPINASAAEPTSVAREGLANGPLAGEVLVFTGALGMPRKEAADRASAMGCEVVSNVTKKTTIVVIGDTDVRRLAGHEKSAKHRKAEKMMAEGLPVRLIRETDFLKMTEST